MKNYRAFKVESLPPTNTNPAKVKITDLRFSKSVVLNYSAHSADNSKDLAIEYLKGLNIEIAAQAWHENKNSVHQYSLYMTENFTDQIN